MTDRRRQLFETLSRIEEKKEQGLQAEVARQAALTSALGERAALIRSRREALPASGVVSASDLRAQVSTAEDRLEEFDQIQARLQAIKEAAAGIRKRAVATSKKAMIYQKLSERGSRR